MKKILLVLLAAMTMVGCKTDNSDHTHLDVTKATPPELVPFNINIINLEKQYAKSQITFRWNPVDYGFDAPVNYLLQIDQKGSDFEKSQELASVEVLTMASITYEKLNSILVNRLGFEPAKEGEPAIVYQFDVRVVSSISSNVANVSSKPMTLNVTTYQDKVVIASLGVPGNYIPVGGGDSNWTPGNPLTRVWDLKNDKNYVGYISMFTKGDNLAFKFVDGDTWDDPQFVSEAPVKMDDGSYEAEFVDGKGGDILGLAQGYYQISVDLSVTPGKYIMKPITALGITGSATTPEWSDTGALPLTYNVEEGVWEAKDLVLKDGEFLILANNSWDFKFGKAEDGLPGVLICDSSSKNIPGPGAGKYHLKVNLTGSTLTYEFIPQ